MPFTRQITGLSQARIRRDHVVEEAHVPAIFLRVAGVVFGIFLGIAAGAERLVAGSGEYDGNDIACGTRLAEGKDHAFNHVGGVRVELRRVVEGDPAVEQTGYGLAVGPAHGTLFVKDAFADRFAHLIGHESVVFRIVRFVGDYAGRFRAHLNSSSMGRNEDSAALAVTIVLTIFTDIAALLVVAVCIPIHTAGFSATAFGLQVLEPAIYVPLVLLTLSWAAGF